MVALTGAEAGPFNIYSMPGLVLVVAAYTFPYVFVFTKSALDLISSEMEDAANILGAGNLQHHAARSRCRWCCRRSWAPSSWCSWKPSRCSARRP